MTSRDRSDQGFRWGRLARPSLYLFSITVPAAAFMALAFGTAGGEAIEISRDSYDTSELVMNSDWWLAAYLLAVPVFVVAHRYPRLAVIGAVIVAVPQWATAHIYFTRFVETGWGDGLEGLAYFDAALRTVLFAGAAALGVHVQKRSAPQSRSVDGK